ncbi:MAG TPA: DUF2917 domain-containing protein [Planctomycetota bacterium]|jgi:hypothetical protein|nr:DUF2917 domain-containing protein [Planctomycetota bacterium]
MNTTDTSRPASLNAPLRVVMAAGDLLRLTPGRPVMVTCLQGTCWLTQEGDALDHLLGAGMSHQVIARGLTIIQAFNDCVVELPVDAVQRSRRATAA